MVSVWRRIFGITDQPVRRRPDEADKSFARQMKFEAEGGAAAMDGKTRENCPYDPTSQSFEWNHWVYGCECAQSEIETLKRGTITWHSTAVIVSTDPNIANQYGVPLYTETVAEAIARGTWKPRFVNPRDVK